MGRNNKEQTGIIDSLIKKLAIKLIAKAIGQSPEFVQKWWDIIMGFINEIIGLFDKEEEAVEYMKTVTTKIRTSQRVKARAAIKRVSEDL